MKLPKRPKTHVIETESGRLLQSLVPEEWIVRDPPERDYGIDLYIEQVSKDGYLTGQLMAVQLKGQQNIEWKTIGWRTACRKISFGKDDNGLLLARPSSTSVPFSWPISPPRTFTLLPFKRISEQDSTN